MTMNPDTNLHPMQSGPKLTLENVFEFACGPHVPCFTECCGKLDLLLTPYDVLKIRKRLNISSADFLDEYTIMRWKTGHGFPEVMLKMDTETKRCPFVTSEGCSIYEDRPGACRVYPLGRAATVNSTDGSKQEFYFTVKEEHCMGFEESTKWTVRDWLENQGMPEYNRMNDLLMELYVLSSRSKTINIGPQHLQMFVMACYNTERFRDFIFKSGFLQKIELDQERVNELEKSDLALLEFAFIWLKFALFRQPTLKPRSVLHAH